MHPSIPEGSSGSGGYRLPEEYGPPPSRGPATTGPLPRPGFLAALLDVNFDYMVTPTVVKAFSLLSLLLISAQCTLFLALGLWVSGWRNGWAWGLIMVIASPVVWLFEVLLVRLLLESVIVRFRTAEYLRVIKDKL